MMKPLEDMVAQSLRHCDELIALIEEDQMDLRYALVGEAYLSYQKLTNREMELLEDCKRLIERGR